MKKQPKTRLDEMQEQTLLKIEHNGCYLAFAGLAIALAVQCSMGGAAGLRQVAGELAVFLALSVYLIAACLRHGIWDRRLRANFKTNLAVSLLAGLAAGLISGIWNYRQYGIAWAALLAAAITFGLTFLLSIAALSICARLYRRRADALENSLDE